MPDVGTCPKCGRRVTLVQAQATGTFVLHRHNAALKTRCEGSGQPPLAGTTSYQAPGRSLPRDTP